MKKYNLSVEAIAFYEHLPGEYTNVARRNWGRRRNKFYYLVIGRFYRILRSNSKLLEVIY